MTSWAASPGSPRSWAARVVTDAATARASSKSSGSAYAVERVSTSSTAEVRRESWFPVLVVLGEVVAQQTVGEQAAANLTLTDILPFGICNEVTPMAEPTGL